MNHKPVSPGDEPIGGITLDEIQHETRVSLTVDLKKLPHMKPPVEFLTAEDYDEAVAL